MKQMQCNATPSLNIIKTTAKQVWLSVGNIRRNYAASIRRHYHNCSDCFEYPKYLYLNQATQKKFLPNFPTQKHPGIENFKPKKSFDHPRHLKSGVPPWNLLAGEKPQHLRLVFTSDGVGVGVVIRSVKRYDLVKIKQRSRKQSFLLRLRFRRLRSSENQFVGVVSKSGRTKPIIKRGNEHRDWFILPLLLPTPTIWFSLDRKRRNRKRSRKKMETF